MKEIGGGKKKGEGKRWWGRVGNTFLDLDHQLMVLGGDLWVFILNEMGKIIWNGMKAKTAVEYDLSEECNFHNYQSAPSMICSWLYSISKCPVVCFCAHTYTLTSVDVSKAFTWNEKKPPFSSLCQPRQMTLWRLHIPLYLLSFEQLSTSICCLIHPH